MIDKSILIDIKIYPNSISLLLHVLITKYKILNLSIQLFHLEKNKNQFRRLFKKIDTYEPKYIKYKIIMKYGFLTKVTNIFIFYFFFNTELLTFVDIMIHTSNVLSNHYVAYQL